MLKLLNIFVCLILLITMYYILYHYNTYIMKIILGIIYAVSGFWILEYQFLNLKFFAYFLLNTRVAILHTYEPISHAWGVR